MAFKTTSYLGIFRWVNLVRKGWVSLQRKPWVNLKRKEWVSLSEFSSYTTELNEIKQAWNKFLNETQNTKPGSYDLIFPDKMIESITQNVLKGCQNIGLRSYTEQLKLPSQSVASLVNEAWAYIRSNHSGFGTWEAQKLENLIQTN